MKPADLEDDEDVARLLSDEVMSGVYQFLMPDHGGSDTSAALAIQGGDETPSQETIFCNEKRTIMTKFIFGALLDDPSIAWTDLCVNSADYLLNGREQWRWYQANAEGYHVITSADEDGRRLHRDVLEHVRVAADAYSRAVVAAVQEKKKDTESKTSACKRKWSEVAGLKRFSGCTGDSGAIQDLFTFSAAGYDGNAEEWDPRVQTLLLQGSCDRIQKEVTTALASLVNIFCRVAIHATQLNSLDAREQQRLAEAAAAKFFSAVTSLRLDHAYTWQALIDLGDFLEEKYKATYLLWLEYAKAKLEGRSGVPIADSHEVFCAFFESLQELAG